MRLPERVPFAKCMLVAALAALAPVAAQAQTTCGTLEVGGRDLRLVPGDRGTTSFPTGASGPSIDVSADQLIDAMKFAFMGQIQGRKGKWGIWSDLVYSDMGGSQHGSRDFTVGGQQVGVDADLSFDAKMWVWSLAGLYNLDARPESTVDLLFGARLLDQEQTLDWTLSSTIAQLPGRSGSSEISSSYWDAIVGIKGRHSFGEGGQMVPAVLPRRRWRASRSSPGRSMPAWPTSSTGEPWASPGATWTTSSSLANPSTA